MSLEVLFNCEVTHIKRNPDAIVCCLHSYMTSNGFKCVANGEKIPTELVKKSDMLPPNWSNGDDNYALVYQRDGTSDTYVLKIIEIDSSLLVHLHRTRDETTADMEVEVTKYTTNSDIKVFDGIYKNLEDLQTRFVKELLGPFQPQKATENKSQRGHDSTKSQAAPPPRSGQPSGYRPEWEQPFNDPLRDPLSIGRGDLDPLQGGMSGGMVYDPLRSGFPRGGGQGGIGGPSIPRGSVIPGARFDPFGPPDLDIPGNPHRGWRSGPDPDDFPPPGFDNAYM